MSGKVAAFATFDIKLRNDRWSWSGISADGKLVVLQLWEDHFDRTANPPSWSDFDDVRLLRWKNRLGNRYRIQDLIWCRDNCEGKFRAVIAHAISTDSDVRRTGKAYPETKLWMRIVRFNETTGELHAELVK